ncbi:hypothetical protein [Candidatus Ichthyocystis hellenicum]|uniref:hypothetical protein n=1 Tax=Candidatus Ichthyocystis hellenicum TaxID=1561003 RepID=UPI000B825C20|nr:hypothetical protein [Candidatus Ichthyocystis hellenicum]
MSDFKLNTIVTSQHTDLELSNDQTESALSAVAQDKKQIDTIDTSNINLVGSIADIEARSTSYSSSLTSASSLGDCTVNSNTETSIHDAILTKNEVDTFKLFSCPPEKEELVFSIGAVATASLLILGVMGVLESTCKSFLKNAESESLSEKPNCFNADVSSIGDLGKFYCRSRLVEKANCESIVKTVGGIGLGKSYPYLFFSCLLFLAISVCSAVRGFSKNEMRSKNSSGNDKIADLTCTDAIEMGKISSSSEDDSISSYDSVGDWAGFPEAFASRDGTKSPEDAADK